MANDALLVAAIDFGTTFSGWAFSFRHEYEADPTKVTSKQWIGGNHVSLKGPTCVLINPDSKQLDSFGYDAEDKYADLAEKEEHVRWYFFKQFKMMLFGKIGVQRSVVLEDEMGHRMAAKTVFSLVIAHLKEDLMKMCKDRVTGDGFETSEVQWVITVPAIWNDAAKQFMREAAIEAGIDNRFLKIALEPEAASLYCRHLPVEKTKGGSTGSLASFKPGTKYMVLDAGGGTVDITVHEVLRGRKLKEIRKASGGAWGGTKVDKAFLTFLQEIFTKPVMDDLKTKHMDDYIDILRDFEVKKRDINPEKDAKVVLRIPVNLVNLFKNRNKQTVQDAIAASSYKEKCSFAGDRMKIDASVCKGFFHVAVDNILDHVENILHEKHVGDCSAIVMVGGFSESPMLYEVVRKTFKKVKVIVPEGAGLAVLKGAVIYGHEPTTIVSRVCKMTYGVKSSVVFDPDCHPQDKKYKAADKDYCDDIFDVHVKVDQSVNIGEDQAEQTYNPVHHDQKEMRLVIYASNSPNPRFVTDTSCTRLGEFTVDIPDTTGDMDRKVLVHMTFGGTEIEVRAEDENTGNIFTTKVDFLS